MCILTSLIVASLFSSKARKSCFLVCKKENPSPQYGSKQKQKEETKTKPHALADRYGLN